jgi:hypothetical protein
VRAREGREEVVQRLLVRQIDDAEAHADLRLLAMEQIVGAAPVRTTTRRWLSRRSLRPRGTPLAGHRRWAIGAPFGMDSGASLATVVGATVNTCAGRDVRGSSSQGNQVHLAGGAI